MNMRPLLPLLALLGASQATIADEQIVLLASASHSPILLEQPADLERHTSKVAEFRLNEITEDLEQKLNDKMLENLTLVSKEAE